MTVAPPTDAALALIEFIDASPSPYHAAETTAALLEAAGFRRGDPTSVAVAATGGSVRGVSVTGGSVVAWSAPRQVGPTTTFRLIGAHTDSPNLRIKPNPDVQRNGLAQLGVEVYGGVLLNSWLDRDLGLSGRVAVRGDGAPVLHLFRIDEPLLRIPQLAIHLDREINDKGLLLNKQQHLAPLWATVGEDGTATRFAEVVGEAVGAAAADVLAWDAMVHPLEPSRVVGLHREFVSAPRIDNQLSCFAAASALAAVAGSGDGGERAGGDGPDTVTVVVLFDHEEVGSTSDRGAAGGYLSSVLERIWLAAGGDRAGYLRALAEGCCLSADCAHATNPNYADRHEPEHRIALGGGPVLKVNANVRQRHRRRLGGAVGAGLRTGRGGPAALRQPHRSGLRVHDRSADGGRAGHPHRRRGRGHSWRCTRPGLCAVADVAAAPPWSSSSADPPPAAGRLKYGSGTYWLV
ncbi:MAG: M18 family aminopeptidase [Acidimicrobiales bacterium]